MGLVPSQPESDGDRRSERGNRARGQARAKRNPKETSGIAGTDRARGKAGGACRRAEGHILSSVRSPVSLRRRDLFPAVALRYQAGEFGQKKIGRNQEHVSRRIPLV